MNSRKSNTAFNLICCLLFFALLSNLSLFSQSAQEEKIVSLIKEITPTYAFQKSLYDLDIIGYDVLNEAKNPVDSEEFAFLPGSPFYINLYGKKKIIHVAAPKGIRVSDFEAVLESENEGFFRSTLTNSFLAEKEVNLTPDQWQVGGIYKFQFHFLVPESVLPGKYKLRIKKRNVTYLNTNIKIDIIGYSFLNEAKDPLGDEELTFLPGSLFFVNFYGQKKIEKIAEAIEDESMGPHYYAAVFKQKNEELFGSTMSSLVLQEKGVPGTTEKEEMGKVQFHFEVPESTPPGQYGLKIVRGNSVYFNTNINIDIIGYDVLDEAYNHRNSEEFIFLQRGRFYVDFYGEKKVAKIAEATEDESMGPHYYAAVFKQKNEELFGSTMSSRVSTKKGVPGAAEVEGIEKVRFHFEVPESAPPGQYGLKIVRGNSVYLNTNINMDVIGYDVLDEAFNRLDSKEATFSPGDNFYINLYGRKKIREIAEAIEDESKGPHYYVAVFKQKNEELFRSAMSSLVSTEKTVPGMTEKEEIGKVRFHFKVLESVLPGLYNLRVAQGPYIFLNTNIDINIRNR